MHGAAVRSAEVWLLLRRAVAVRASLVIMHRWLQEEEAAMVLLEDARKWSKI